MDELKKDIIDKVKGGVFRAINENDVFNYRLLDEDEDACDIITTVLCCLSSYYITCYMIFKTENIHDSMKRPIVNGIIQGFIKDGKKDIEQVGKSEEEWIASLRGAEMRLGIVLEKDKIASLVVSLLTKSDNNGIF